jgi:hypothetical protein
MPSWGGGLAHALTQGFVGAQQGINDRELFVLAAQQRAQQRQQQEREMKLKELGALSAAAQAGLDIGDDAATPVAVPDTASRRVVNEVNPTSPEGGGTNQAPATGSQDGTVIGAVQGKAIKIPAGGVVGKAARDDAAKQAQRTADLLNRAQPLNAKLPAGHPYKLSDDQLRSIAADPTLYNEWAKGALGITKDPVAMHRANRDYDVAHPTKNVGVGDTGPLVQIEDPSNPGGPGIFVPRSQAAGHHAPSRAASARSTVSMQKAVAANQTQVSIIDDALAELQRHPNAVGLMRGLGDNVNQRIDPEGNSARASIANIASMIVHDRSGAAVTVSEYPAPRAVHPQDHRQPEEDPRLATQTPPGDPDGDERAAEPVGRHCWHSTQHSPERDERIAPHLEVRAGAMMTDPMDTADDPKAKVRRNVEKMASQGASSDEIESYIQSTGLKPVAQSIPGVQAESTAARPRPKPSTLSPLAALAPVAQGLTLGAADEILGAVEGANQALHGGSFKKGYTEGRDKVRAGTKQFAEENPVTSAALTIAGGIAPALLGPGKGLIQAGTPLLVGSGSAQRKARGSVVCLVPSRRTTTGRLVRSKARSWAVRSVACFRWSALASRPHATSPDAPGLLQESTRTRS